MFGMEFVFRNLEQWALSDAAKQGKEPLKNYSVCIIRCVSDVSASHYSVVKAAQTFDMKICKSGIVQQSQAANGFIILDFQTVWKDRSDKSRLKQRLLRTRVLLQVELLLVFS